MRILAPAVLLLFSIFFFESALADKRNNLDDLIWLLGEWVAENRDNTVVEKWRAVSDSTFEGYGFTLQSEDGKMISHESLRLVAMSGETFYLAKVGHNKMPIPFRLAECKKSLARFENPQHDFPTSITYRLVALDTLSVKVGNGEKQFEILFRRGAEK